MALVEIKWKPSDRELRQFTGIWLPLAAALIGFWIWRATHQGGWAAVPLAVTAVFAVIGWFAPAVARPVYLVWMAAIFPIGWTISHLILGFVYYGVMTPIGLLLRLFGYDAMQRKIDSDTESYWSERSNDTNDNRYFRQF